MLENFIKTEGGETGRHVTVTTGTNVQYGGKGFLGDFVLTSEALNVDF